MYALTQVAPNPVSLEEIVTPVTPGTVLLRLRPQNAFAQVGCWGGLQAVLTIRVTPYWGDLDTLGEVLVIGPYDTEASREVACDRLNRLGFKNGDATFDLSELSPAGADGSCTPAEADACANVEDLADVLYSLPPV